MIFFTRFTGTAYVQISNMSSCQLCTSLVDNHEKHSGLSDLK